jgi:8-oxo-dGTP pyrophosphatase MutT (NUDIX family)
MRTYVGEASGISVTATPHFGGRFLIIRRSLADKALPGRWAFPGGRVQYYKSTDRATEGRLLAETLTATAVREVEEETGLRSSGRAFYVDSYDSLGKRAAAHFCVDVVDDRVELNSAEVMDFRWVEAVEEMQDLRPRISGLDNHLEYILDELSGRHSGPFRPLSTLDLTHERYRNNESSDGSNSG